MNKKEWIKKSLSKFTINNITTPCVSAVIYSMLMPASASWYHVLVGALFGIIIGKLVFGGTGQNIFNPAALGRLVATICFGNKWTYSSNSFYDVAIGGTPLQQLQENLANIGNYKLSNMFLGFIPGTLGEISAICIILGAIYLLLRKSADFRQMASMLVSFIIIMFVAGLKLDVNPLEYTIYHVLSGGFLFGLVFMITDPVTTPTTAPGRVIFGTLVASIVALLCL